MHSVDFFSRQYFREPSTTSSRFGINDGIENCDDSAMAYTLRDNSVAWNACVSNANARSLIFEPLDHNIVIHPSPDTTYSLCDGMLYDTDITMLIFIELKVVRKGWIQENVNQLKSTINLFRANHDLSQYKTRRAYAANKLHPNFQFSHKVAMQQFYNETSVRLLIQNEIEIP